MAEPGWVAGGAKRDDSDGWKEEITLPTGSVEEVCIMTEQIHSRPAPDRLAETISSSNT